MSKSEKKEIKIISGDGKNLEISKVYEHLCIAKPKVDNKKDKNIVIPKEKKNKN